MDMKPKTVGILGGGQLAQMLALAAHPLGIQTICYSDTADCSAARVTRVEVGSLDDKASLQKFASACDVLTFESENIEIKHLESVKALLHPSLHALEVAQNRLLEKECFLSLNIPTTRFLPVDSLEDLKKAVEVLDFPIVLKTCRLGYDGKGQYVIRGEEDIAAAWKHLPHEDLIAEAFVSFEREVSVLAVRGLQGEIRYYPMTENHHESGILRHTFAPHHDVALWQQATAYLEKILVHLNYVGVLAVEFFQVGQRLIANEMAPRVHNSGHWTIEGAQTSQFENHLRALLGLPLGATEALGYSAMVNFIGEELPLEKALALAPWHYHHYAKAPRPLRKLAHATLCHTDAQRLREQLKKVLQELS